jgi:sugar lactone lactonase YvrE
MRTSSLLVVAAGTALLAACSGGSVQAPGAGVIPTSTFGQRAARGVPSRDLLESPLIYVPSYTDQAGGQVVVYRLPLRKHPRPVETITIPEGKNSVPQYDALDDSGNLYLSSNSDSEIQVYPPGDTQPSYIITDGISYPLGVAVDKSGTLYVANTAGYSYNYIGTITEYPPGYTSPSVTITGFNNPEGIGLDSHDNLWVINDYVPKYGWEIFEIKKGTTTPISKTFNNTEYPIDIAVDKKENVYISDISQNVVNIYGKGQSSPKQQIHPPYGTLVQTYGICFNGSGDLFVTYIEDSQSTLSAIVEYKDPIKNPKAIRVITSANGLPGASGGCAAARP